MVLVLVADASIFLMARGSSLSLPGACRQQTPLNQVLSEARAPLSTQPLHRHWTSRIARVFSSRHCAC